MRQTIRIHWPGILLFVLALSVGLLTFKDYGVNWDDPYQRNIGLVNYDYITKNDPSLTTYEFKEYGPAYEILLVVVEKALHLTDTRAILLMRHLVTHLVFLLGVCFVYLLAYRLFGNRLLACMCLLMVLFAPRIYAHSFFNTKDIPFFAAMSVALYACTIAFQRPQTRLFLLAGLVCGLTTGVRIMGVMLVTFIIFFLLVDILIAFLKKQGANRHLNHLLVFVLGFSASLYACFPFLWTNPFSNFAHCFSVMSHYRWYGTIFQSGRLITSDHIPWYVLPVWFLITNPLGWLALGFGGIGLFLAHFLRRPVSFILPGAGRIFLLVFLCFITPLLAVIGLHSVVYEDWRHLFFVYPFFVLLAVYLVHWLWRTRLGVVVLVGVSVQLLVTAYTMCRVFPHNQVYFNPLVTHSPGYLRAHYEMDYWGVSSKQGLDYILATDSRPLITVAADRATYCPVENNIWMLKAADRKRIKLVLKDAPFDYFLTDYRTHPLDYDYPPARYSVTAFNSTILGIYLPYH